MLQTLVAPGRTVYWVGAPILKDAKKDAGVQLINAAQQAVIARHPEVTYVDSYHLFSDPLGKYTQTIPGPYGKPVRMRAGDGIHFTPEGGDRLANAVYTLLDARCRVRSQAVPGVQQKVIQSKGSTQIPGTGRSAGHRAARRADADPRHRGHNRSHDDPDDDGRHDAGEHHGPALRVDDARRRRVVGFRPTGRASLG